MVEEQDNAAPSIAQQQRVGVVAAEVLHPQPYGEILFWAHYDVINFYSNHVRIGYVDKQGKGTFHTLVKGFGST